MLHARLVIVAARKRRRYYCRHAKPQQRLATNQVRIDSVGSRRTRRRNMVEKSSPLVIVHDEYGLRPAWPIGHCMKCLSQEGVAGTDVGVRMIVVAGAIVCGGEARIEK